jgi:hypothetical protein
MNEEKLQQILALLEQGKSNSEILALFPQEKKEVESILNLDKTLKQANSVELPEKNLLKLILTDNINRQRHTQGRGLFLKQIIQTMNQKFKILIPLSAALVIALIVLVKYDQNQSVKTANEAAKELEQRNLKQQEYANSLPELQPLSPNANVDETVNGIVADLETENSILSEGDEDVAYVTQSYNINIDDIYNENDY